MLRQTTVMTLMMLQTVPRRWGSSLVVVISLAGVVGVLVSVLAMAQGLQKTLQQNGRPDRVVVLRSGQNNEAGSRMTHDQVETLLTTPGLARDDTGEPIASAEFVTIAGVTRIANGKSTNVTVRGVGEKVLQVRPEAKLIDGRWFTRGLRELVVARRSQAVFAGLDVGGQVRISDSVWTVVGVFETGGSIHESELWGDVQTVLAAARQTQYNSVTALLQSDAAFTAYQDHIATNPTLQHKAWREPEFLQSQAGFTAIIRTLGQAIAAIMALGALFAAVNTLYAAVSARTVEIATLRALGFGATPVVISVLLEGLLLCVAGAALGGALAYLIFDGYTVAAAGSSGGQVAFAFSVSPELLLKGLIWGCSIGVLGGLFPALRAARMPVAEGLRAA